MYYAKRQAWRRFCNDTRRKELKNCAFWIVQWIAYWQILEENLLLSVQQLGLGTNFISMHGNDPKHTSADLNPIEYLWDVLEDRVKKHHSKNKIELAIDLMEEWNKLNFL